MGRDFYLLPIGYGKKGVLFHSPSFNVNLVDNYEQLGDVTDEMLYELLPDLKEIHTENIEKTVGIGKIGLTFMSSRFCNLKCIYCFAGEGEYGRKRDKPKGMTASSYIEVVKKSLQLYPQGISSINFFGGEPMLNWKEIHKFVDALSGILEQKGLSRPCIGISTNGTIMNAEIAQYFKRENIVVGISLDGTKYINDRARKYKYSTHSVYDYVLDCIKILKRFQVGFVVEMTITKIHLEQYRQGKFRTWMEDLDSLNGVNTVIVPVETDVFEVAIRAEDYKKLDMVGREMANYYLEELLKDEPQKYSTTIFNILIQIAKKSRYSGCNAGKHLFIDTDGKVYPCHMFCNCDDYSLGDFHKNTFDFVKMQDIANVNNLESEECQHCISRNNCVFWCKGMQYLSKNDMYSVIKSRCIYQKAIMEECIKFMVKLSSDKGNKSIVLKNLKLIYTKINNDLKL